VVFSKLWYGLGRAWVGRAWAGLSWTVRGLVGTYSTNSKLTTITTNSKLTKQLLQLFQQSKKGTRTMACEGGSYIYRYVYIYICYIYIYINIKLNTHIYIAGPAAFFAVPLLYIIIIL